MPVYSLVQDSQNRLYAGGEGVYRSTDRGSTWEDMSQGLSTKAFTAALAIDSHDVLFAGKREK
jgi:ligand-binding sensor domain-containing protein